MVAPALRRCPRPHGQQILATAALLDAAVFVRVPHPRFLRVLVRLYLLHRPP